MKSSSHFFFPLYNTAAAAASISCINNYDSARLLRPTLSSCTGIRAFCKPHSSPRSRCCCASLWLRDTVGAGLDYFTPEPKFLVTVVLSALWHHAWEGKVYSGLWLQRFRSGVIWAITSGWWQHRLLSPWWSGSTEKGSNQGPNVHFNGIPPVTWDLPLAPLHLPSSENL